jgi:hypothetical protein
MLHGADSQPEASVFSRPLIGSNALTACEVREKANGGFRNGRRNQTHAALWRESLFRVPQWALATEKAW